MSVDLIVSISVTCLFWHVLPSASKDGQVQGESHHGRVQQIPLVKLPPGDESQDLPELETYWSKQERVGVASALWLDSKTRRWLAAVAVTAITGFGLLLMNPNPNGPLSNYNRERLRGISASLMRDVAAAAKKPRVFCVMMHIEQGRSVRREYAEAMGETWGRHCDGYIAWDERRSDIEPLDIAAAAAEPPTDSLAGDRWLRARHLWRHIARNELQHYDWFVAVDDGGFVFVENLLRVVAALGSDGTLAAQNAQVLVNLGAWASWGYVLSAAAVKEFIAGIDSRGPGCPVPSREGTAGLPEEYSTVLKCLESRELKATAWDDHPAVRETLGCKDGDHSVLNFKARQDGICRHAVLAYMVPNPSWLRDISVEVYGGRD